MQKGVDICTACLIIILVNVRQNVHWGFMIRSLTNKKIPHDSIINPDLYVPILLKTKLVLVLA